MDAPFSRVYVLLDGLGQNPAEGYARLEFTAKGETKLCLRVTKQKRPLQLRLYACARNGAMLFAGTLTDRWDGTLPVSRENLLAVLLLSPTALCAAGFYPKLTDEEKWQLLVNARCDLVGAGISHEPPPDHNNESTEPLCRGGYYPPETRCRGELCSPAPQDNTIAEQADDIRPYEETADTANNDDPTAPRGRGGYYPPAQQNTTIAERADDIRPYEETADAANNEAPTEPRGRGGYYPPAPSPAPPLLPPPASIPPVPPAYPLSQQLHPLIYPPALRQYESLLAQGQPCAPFQATGWRFVHLPFSKDAVYPFCVAGVLQKQGRVCGTAFLLPGAYSPTPPEALPGYRYLMGQDGQGYWACFATA